MEDDVKYFLDMTASEIALFPLLFYQFLIHITYQEK